MSAIIEQKVVRSAVVAHVWEVAMAAVDRLRTAAPGWVVAALALYIGGVIIVGARWRGFLRMVGGDVSTVRASLATLGGIAIGNLTPSSRLAGEVCRMTLGGAGTPLTWRQLVIATGWDRLSELPPIAVLVIMGAFAARDLAAAWRAFAVAGAVAAVAAVIAIGIARRRAAAASPSWIEQITRHRCDRRVLATGVAWSTAMWLQDGLRLTCATLAFGVVLSPTRVAALAVVAMLGGLVPTIGGVGAVEGGLVSGLIAFGVDMPSAAAITAVERAISFGFSTTAGGAVVMLLGGRSLWAAVSARNQAGKPAAILPTVTPDRSEPAALH
jgi:uncharacterized membrane protein YbhN (UPF0104 family)